MFFQSEWKSYRNVHLKHCSAVVTQLSDAGSQPFSSHIRTVPKFHGKGLMVVPFNPAQIQSTQKKYSLDPINRSREMCHGLVSKCISFIKTNYKCCAIQINLTLKKKWQKGNTQLARHANQKILTCQYYLIKSLLKKCSL